MIIGAVNTPPCNKLEAVVPGKISAVVPAEGISCCQGKIIGMVNKNVAVKKVEQQWRQTAAHGEWAKATRGLKRAVEEQFSMAVRSKSPPRWTHGYSIPDGMDLTQWEQHEIDQPYVEHVLQADGFRPYCCLCGKRGECRSHWAGREHLFQVFDPLGNAQDPSSWKRAMPKIREHSEIPTIS